MSKFNVVRLWEAAKRDNDEEKFFDEIQESLDNSEISAKDFSFSQLFEGFVDDGAALLSQWRLNPESRVGLMEAGADSTAFSNITGQLLINETMDAYEGPQQLSGDLSSPITTRLPHGEKIIGLSEIGDEAEAVGEAQPYPYVAFGEDWIETPETIKRGMIVALTREILVQDLTGQLIERARGIGEWMGYNKELRVLQTALGITSSYKRKNKSIVATYGDNSGDHDFDNLAASNALTDWTNIEAAELLFDGMTDPNTGTPISVVPNAVVVPSALKHTANRLFNASNIEHVDNQANAATIRTNSPNPVAGAYQVLSSQLVKTVTSSTSTWFMGDFKKAFAYMEVSPAQMVQAPTNSHDEFHRDIVNQWKVSEWGVAAVKDPRYVVKCTA